MNGTTVVQTLDGARPAAQLSTINGVLAVAEPRTTSWRSRVLGDEPTTVDVLAVYVAGELRAPGGTGSAAPQRRARGSAPAPGRLTPHPVRARDVPSDPGPRRQRPAPRGAQVVRRNAQQRPRRPGATQAPPHAGRGRGRRPGPRAGARPHRRRAALAVPDGAEPRPRGARQREVRQAPRRPRGLRRRPTGDGRRGVTRTRHPAAPAPP